MNLFQKEKFSSMNMDALGDIFFGNSLEVLQSSVYEFKYAPYKAFELIPVNYDFPAGVEYITATGFQSVGRARIIDSYADDLPEAGILGMQLTNKVVSIGSSYRYSHQEIRRSQMANLPLESKLALSARKAIEQEINKLALLGNNSGTMFGLINNPNIPVVLVPADGVGASTLWINKTPDQILRDMNLVVNQIVINSSEVEKPNTLLLPLAQYTLISSTPRSANSDTTILNYFLMNNPYITNVEALPQLAGSGATGADIMMAYDNASDKLQMNIPLPFTQYSPQERNLEFVIPCEARFGGVSCWFPLSMIKGEGI